VVGDIVELAQRYAEQGADELVFYDITASPQNRSVDTRWVERIAAAIDIPFCVAGGIRDVTELAEAFGSQCVVVGIDSIGTPQGYRVKQLTGQPDSMQDANRNTLEWIAEAQRLGAGEIVLNCMDADGVRQGYHLPHLQQARALCQVPLIASGRWIATATACYCRLFRKGPPAIWVANRVLMTRTVTSRHTPEIFCFSCRK